MELAKEQLTNDVSPLPSELRPFEYLLGRFEGGIEVFAADQMTSLVLDMVNGSPVPSLEELVRMLRLQDARTLAQNPLDIGWYEERSHGYSAARYSDYQAYRKVIATPESLQVNTDKYWDDLRTGEKSVKGAWSFPDSFNGQPVFTRCRIFEQPGNPQHPENTYLQTFFDIMPNRYTLLFTMQGQPFGEDTAELAESTVGGTYALDGTPIRTIS